MTDRDAAGLATAWDDAREFYARLDGAAFVPPDPADDGLGAWLVDGLRRDAEDPDRFVRVADLDGQALGFLTASFEPPVESAGRQLVRAVGRPRVLIGAVVVQRALWRSGIGRGLLTAAEQWASRRGADLVQLDTYAESPVSVPFYESLGYERRAIVFVRTLETPVR